MIVTSMDKNNVSTIEVYIFNEIANKTFVRDTNYQIESLNGIITNLIASDFNMDHKVDFLISVLNDETVSHILLLQYDKLNFRKSNALTITSPKDDSSIFVGDFNGDKM